MSNQNDVEEPDFTAIAVYDGTSQLGDVHDRDDQAAATLVDGTFLGLFRSRREATDAILRAAGRRRR